MDTQFASLDRYRDLYSGQPRNVASFFGMIHNLDDNLGRLEAMLRETGMRDNTILIFLTDNGGTAGVNLYNAGMRGRKITLWDGGHRVPFFIRWPEGRLTGGRDAGELTIVQDVLPTLIELCSLRASAGAQFDGVSLAPLLRGTTKQLADRMAVIQFSRMNAARPQWSDATVLWKKWRLVSNSALYDVAKDPAQQHNMLAEFPEITAKMRAHYDQWWSKVTPRLDTFLPVHIGSDQENPTFAFADGMGRFVLRSGSADPRG